MTSENERAWIEDSLHPRTTHMQKFKLFKTCSSFYMIGRDKKRTFWKVLKIDRLEPSELNICEDPITYSEKECYDLLRRINEGNRGTGGLKFVTSCYGIVGFIKFLGPYYMLLITRRRKVGAFCGHAVYAIAKSEMIQIPNSVVQSTMTSSKNENRYKKLLCTMDLTKDFFFSYSYNVMCSLQKNLCDSVTGQFVYETMFVWNEFLTRGIRSQLKNTLWTVALIYGFFKQVKLSICGRDFRLTLIARRSRHFAGTRYLKRGVNEMGQVANDVETEQIVSEDMSEGCHLQISSVVQNRGSIPLFWSQETSRLNIKPDIILSRKDHHYEATRLHFENLAQRYGNPIIILNLIKSREKRPRESILRAEFANAIDIINKDLSSEDRLMFLHWDLHKQSRNKDANVLSLLGKVAAFALNLTGFFYCQVPQIMADGLLDQACFGQKNHGGESFLGERNKSADNLERENSNSGDGIDFFKFPIYQKGVLRTNCIDCLDRTNVAQYAYGLVALGHQLYELGFTDSPTIDLDDHVAVDLMGIYELMGDKLAFQYGGSAAHNKIFSERRGQWKAAAQSMEFLRTLQRYYSNSYMDADKQDAIDLFLGHFQPQQDKPALWELDTDRHIGGCCPSFSDENAGSRFTRSLSDGSILCGSDPPLVARNVVEKSNPNQGIDKALCESLPEISSCESEMSYPRYMQHFPITQTNKHNRDPVCLNKCEDAYNCSNFLDVDCLSSSGNSWDEETYERSMLTSSSTASLSSENVISGCTSDNKVRDQSVSGALCDARQHSDAIARYPNSFVNWVSCGELLSR